LLQGFDVADPNGQLDNAELWRCVEETVRDVLIPALRDDADWALAVAVQLVGLARYAGHRPTSTGKHRVDELAAILDAKSNNELVAKHWRGNDASSSVIDVVGRILAEAVTQTGPDADEIRRSLRPVIVRHLDEDLAVTSPLVNAFRGQLDA
jgi:hypothetical protein